MRPGADAGLYWLVMSRALALVVALAVAGTITVTVAAPRAGAQALDPATAGALAAVLRMLQDPAARASALSTDPQASARDRQMRALAGSDAALQEFYALAADVFDELTRNTGGDATRMSAALQQAAGDPGAFASLLSPRLQQRLRDLATAFSDRPR
jgi:hypothetical protein